MMRHLLLLLTFVLFCLSAFSTDYELYVGGSQVVGGSSTFNVTKDGKIKYDPRSRTLTLHNAVIRDTLCGIHNAGIDSLTILVEGNDSILITGADGLWLEQRTFIRSTDHDGRLCVSAGKAKKDSEADWCALRVGGGNTLRIADCHLKLTSDGWALRSDDLDTLAIVTAEVTALTQAVRRSCIEGFREVTLRSVITSGEETYNTKTRSLNLPNSSSKAQQVLIQGCLYIGSHIVDVASRDTAQAITTAATGIKNGKIHYNGREISLTLDNATVQTTGLPAIRNVSIDGLTISILGSNAITATGSDALSLLYGTTIQGGGKTAGRLTVKSTDGGIYQGGHPYYGNTLTLSGITMEVEAATRGIYGDGKYSQIAIDSTRLKVFSTPGQGSTFRAVGSFAGCTMKNVDTSNGTAWRQATGSFDRNNGTVASEVVIGIPTTYYPVSIMNHRLNNVNCPDFAIEGIEGTGSISYNHATKTLMLNDIAIRQVTGNGYYATGAVWLSEPGYTIRVSGTNSIVHESGIVAKYGGTLTGPGTLDIEATGGSAIFTGSSDMFTVSCAALNAKGYEYGFNASGRGGLTLAAATGQATATHTFSGGSGNIYTPELTLNGMNFYSPRCCYFQQGKIRQNDGRTVNEEVTFRKVTTRYGIKILGEEINNCNVEGIGSPKFQRMDFMHFDEATRTLTLNDFSVSSNDEAMNILDVSGNVRIAANGECNITAAAGAAIKVANDNGTGKAMLTFCGDGTFNVKGKFFSLLVGAYGGVTFADNVVFNGEGAISGNNLGIRGETLTVKDKSYVVCSGQFDSPGVEQFASITISGSGQRIVVPNWGIAKRYDNGYAVADRTGEKAKGQVILGTPVERGFLVGENPVTNANEQDIDGTGHMSYDPQTKQLTLTNANFEDIDGMNAIGIENLSVEGLTIVVVGENTITSRNRAITSDKDLIFTGDGTLTVTSTSSAAVGLYGADCTISGPILNLTGKTYALHGDASRETLRVEKTNTRVTMNTEGRATLTRLKEVVLDKGLYFTTPYAAAFDESFGAITVDGRLYNGTIVISSQEPSAIEGVTYDEKEPTEVIYDLAGRQLGRPRKGMNIIKTGNVRKKEIRRR